MTQSADDVNAMLSTGEAAQLLTQLVGDLRTTGGFSRQTVRRLIASGDLEYQWSRDEVTLDRYGRRIHGHRMVPRKSVEAYARWLRADKFRPGQAVILGRPLRGGYGKGTAATVVARVSGVPEQYSITMPDGAVRTVQWTNISAA
jgi:hypothetical protein